MTQSTLKHPTTPQPKRGKSHSTPGSILTLAGWQLRTTWRLLAVIGLGLLVAVMMVCAIPLYTQVALSQGVIRNLRQDPSNLYLTAGAQSKLFSTESVQAVQTYISDITQRDLGSLIAQTPDLSVQMLVSQTSTTFFNFIGADMKQAQHQIKLVQGCLPAQMSEAQGCSPDQTGRNEGVIEFAATAQEVKDRKLILNKIFTLIRSLPSHFL